MDEWMTVAESSPTMLSHASTAASGLDVNPHDGSKHTLLRQATAVSASLRRGMQMPGCCHGNQMTFNDLTAISHSFTAFCSFAEPTQCG